MYNDYNARAQLLFYSLDLLFGDVLVAVVVEFHGHRVVRRSNSYL